MATHRPSSGPTYERVHARGYRGTHEGLEVRTADEDLPAAACRGGESEHGDRAVGDELVQHGPADRHDLQRLSDRQKVAGAKLSILVRVLAHAARAPSRVDAA